LPGISRLPVIGALFASKAYQRRETDLVIIITPYLVKPMDPSKRPATPFDGSTPPSNVDYFLGNVEEVRPNGAPVGAVHAYAGGATPIATVGHFLELP
jgi:pilus assembly protein CpaC